MCNNYIYNILHILCVICYKILPNISSHLNCVATLYFVKYKFSKIAIIAIYVYKTYVTKQLFTDLNTLPVFVNIRRRYFRTGQAKK